MSSNTRILVVGMTSDYIDWIRSSCPGRALFITTPKARSAAPESAPDTDEEILCELDDMKRAERALDNHLASHGYDLSGIVCFDCEWMAVTAKLAEHFSLPYPSLTAIQNCRNKHTSKVIWSSRNIACSRSRIVGSPEEAIVFFEKVAGPCVLKPTAGSGSALVFYCATPNETAHAYRAIEKQMALQGIHPLYSALPGEKPSILVEAFINGVEYSCDFVIDSGHVTVLRVARKIAAPKRPFGTTLGYAVPASLPEGVCEDDLLESLQKGATALGISRAVCMADFIISDSKIVLIELTPRPGGDCLPLLLRRVLGLDILALTLDFAVQAPIQSLRAKNAPLHVGLRLHAAFPGIIKRIDGKAALRDPRVKEVCLIRKAGHVVRMPPDDYDSWLLGHVIFRPAGKADIDTQCNEIYDLIKVEAAA